MFRNQYDQDVTVWSPQGRLHQVEYAMEAVKQGSATVGLKNKTHAVILALKRSANELSSYQKKIIQVDEHVGCSIAGLTADGRSLSNFMRRQCMDARWGHSEPLAISRLVRSVSAKMQRVTQQYSSRPFGVGLIVAGHDRLGPQIYYLCPSSMSYRCRAIAIGSRSQSARTYLEKHLDELESCSLEQLIHHGLQALNDTLPNDVELTSKNCSLAIACADMPFTMYEDDEVSAYLTGVTLTRARDRDAAAEEATVAGPQPDSATTAPTADPSAQPPPASGGPGEDNTNRPGGMDTE